jgi:hypothetical protein
MRRLSQPSASPPESARNPFYRQSGQLGIAFFWLLAKNAAAFGGALDLRRHRLETRGMMPGGGRRFVPKAGREARADGTLVR